MKVYVVIKTRIDRHNDNYSEYCLGVFKHEQTAMNCLNEEYEKYNKMYCIYGTPKDKEFTSWNEESDVRVRIFIDEQELNEDYII